MQVRSTGIDVLDDVVQEAVGRGRRIDPVIGRSGGPAGNARLTAWTGLALLVLALAEIVTLLDVTGLMSWHVGFGLALTAFALVKTASTAWRFASYYGHRPAYQRAGPPPTLLRVLGPLVIASTLGVLGSGITLVAVGPTRSRALTSRVVGFRVDLVTVHQAFFLLFAVVVGLHLLARFMPAVALSTAAGRRRVDGWSGRVADRAPERIPGGKARAAALALIALVAVVSGVLVIPAAATWRDQHHFSHGGPPGAHSRP